MCLFYFRNRWPTSLKEKEKPCACQRKKMPFVIDMKAKC